MNKLFKTLSILAAIAFLSTACGARAVRAQTENKAALKEASYAPMLGKPLASQEVADFLAANNCAPAASFQLCKSVGMAFWMDNQQVIKTAYLYLNPTGGFKPYQGSLPYGLTRFDTMVSVQQKFGQPVEVHAPQAGWEPGLPDEAGSPDHLHYWAIYRRFGVTIVYDSPGADEDALLYAILVSK